MRRLDSEPATGVAPVPVAAEGPRAGAFGTPLRRRLLAALALTLLPFLIAGVSQAVLGFAEQRRLIESELLASAYAVGEGSRNLLVGTRTLLATVAQQPAIAAGGAACASALEAALQQETPLGELIVLDADGAVRCRAGRPARWPAPLTRQPWFERLARGAPFVIGRTDSGLVLGRAEVRDGAFAGALLATLPSEALRYAPAVSRIHADAAVALLPATGEPLAPVSGRGSDDPDAIPPSALQRLEDEIVYTELFTQSDPRGVERIYVLRPLFDIDAYLLFARPVGAVFGRAELDLAARLVVPLGIGSVALIVAWVTLDRFVLRWVQALERRAAAFAAGAAPPPNWRRWGRISQPWRTPSANATRRSGPVSPKRTR